MMLGKELTDGQLLWVGRFFAPEGRYALFDGRGWFERLRNQPFALTVWAPGYHPLDLRFVDLTAESEVKARLEPGPTPRLTGRILDGGAAVPDAVVSLLPRLPWYWHEPREHAIDLATTAADGGFELAGPAGAYTLRVAHGDCLVISDIELPATGERIVDLSYLGNLSVEVRAPAGGPRVGHRVSLSDAAGRNTLLETDAQGRAAFRCLTAGTFSLWIPDAEGVEVDAYPREWSVQGGQSETVVVTLSSANDAPRFARVVPQPSDSMEGWRARRAFGEWLAVEADGRIPIDIGSLGWPRIEIASPGPERWHVDLPRDARDGYEIPVSLGELRYEGAVLDLAGKALGGVRVSAQALVSSRKTDGGQGGWPSTVTDGYGRFSLPCMLEAPHRLTFNPDPEKHAWHTSGTDFSAVTFSVSRPPSRHGEPIEIRLPRFRGDGFLDLETKHLRGTVLSTTGEAIAGARVAITCYLESQDGQVELSSPAASVISAADGAYEVLVPDVPQYRAKVFEESSWQDPLHVVWSATPGSDERRDFVLHR